MVADTLLGIEMLRAQCRLFMIGSSLFAIGTVPGFAMLCGADAANLLCFMGSWFFTSAALIQLLLSRPSMSRSWEMPSIRAECLSAAIQLFGTLNFNLSTNNTQQAVDQALEKNMNIPDVLRLPQGAHISITIMHPVFFQDVVSFVMRANHQ